jgi:hypothetical protein
MVRIETATNEHGQSLSLEKLSKVMCKIVPKFTVEEKAAWDAPQSEELWPWFTIRDDAVRFTHPSSRWFLGGRAIASYECR